MRLNDRATLITGAGSGIGRATALLFAAEGASVAVADLNGEAARETVNLIEEHGGKAVAVSGDVSDPDSARSMVQDALAALGRIDVLFNNAGIGHVGTLHETEVDDWDRVIRVHLRGVFLMSKYTIPHMLERKSGVVINMSSTIAHIGLEKRAVYTAAKGGVLSLTRSMAVDYAPYNIRVNALCPGTIYTPFVESYLKRSYADPEKALEGIRARQLTGDLGRPEDVAYAALYLASDESKFMTGTGLTIDGGVASGKMA